MESADPEVSRRLRFEIARLAAGKLGELDLAAEALEALHRADPADREAWEPLVDVYRRRGDMPKLVETLGSVIDYVDDLGERARMRLERVRAMVDHRKLGDADAAPLLREILDDDMSQVEAALMLAAILERAGARDDLAELLAKQIEAAKDRADASSVASLTLRLGALLEDADRMQARNAYYTGLDWDPKSAALLDGLLRMLSAEEDAGERADVLERRLSLENGPGAEAMAADLHALRLAAGDEGGAERALAIGYRAYPASESLRNRLAGSYRERADWRNLAELCVLDASARKDPGERVARLREAARIYRTELNDARMARDRARPPVRRGPFSERSRVAPRRSRHARRRGRSRGGPRHARSRDRRTLSRRPPTGPPLRGACARSHRRRGNQGAARRPGSRVRQ